MIPILYTTRKYHERWQFLGKPSLSIESSSTDRTTWRCAVIVSGVGSYKVLHRPRERQMSKLPTDRQTEETDHLTPLRYRTWGNYVCMYACMVSEVQYTSIGCPSAVCAGIWCMGVWCVRHPYLRQWHVNTCNWCYNNDCINIASHGWTTPCSLSNVSTQLYALRLVLYIMYSMWHDMYTHTCVYPAMPLYQTLHFTHTICMQLQCKLHNWFVCDYNNGNTEYAMS